MTTRCPVTIGIPEVVRRDAPWGVSPSSPLMDLPADATGEERAAHWAAWVARRARAVEAMKRRWEAMTPEETLLRSRGWGDLPSRDMWDRWQARGGRWQWISMLSGSVSTFGVNMPYAWVDVARQQILDQGSTMTPVFRPVDPALEYCAEGWGA